MKKFIYASALLIASLGAVSCGISTKEDTNDTTTVCDSTSDTAVECTDSIQ